MEKISHSEGLTWRLGVQSRYESSWMACHRFLYLNAMNGQQFYKVMTDYAGKQRSITGNNFEEYIWKSSDFVGPFSEHMKVRSVRYLFGDAAHQLFSHVSFFKYCPECLQEFFHSPVFYFPCVTHCPVHLLPLASDCKSGKHSIGFISILPDQFKFPLGCSACSREFSEPPFAARAAGEGQNSKKVLELIEEWLQRLREWHFDGIHLDIENNNYSKSIVFEALSEAMAVLCEPPPQSHWMKLQRSTVLVQNSAYFCNFEKHAKNRDSTPLNEDIESACKIIKSIGRHLQRTLHNHCGHRRSGYLYWTSSGKRDCLLMDSNFCPYCSALIQWRAYAGKIIALRDWVRGYERPLLDCHHIFRTKYSVDVNISAEVALSSFTWIAVALARKLRAIQNPNDKMWFTHETHRIEQMKGWEEYELPTYEHEFQFKGIRFKNSNEEVRYFRFSLRFALDELRRCNKGIGPFREKRSREDDVWYVRPSLHKIISLGIRLWPFLYEANLNPRG